MKDHNPKFPVFGTFQELCAGPMLSLACAQVDSLSLVKSISRKLDDLRRVNTPTAAALVTHFTGIITRADMRQGRYHYEAELKRVALGLACIHVGDL